MSVLEKDIFQDLLKHVERVFKQAHPHIKTSIQDWKGEEIQLFQDHLAEKVQGRISEKWFYTHIKSQQEKLPRVDLLNLLALYADFPSWKTFLHEHTTQQNPSTKPKKVKVIVPLLLCGLIAFGLFIFQTSSTEYSFCLLDRDTGLPIPDSSIQITVYQKNESDKLIRLNSNCFKGKDKEGLFQFEVKAKYYQPLHVTRTLSGSTLQEEITLVPDDYSLMIHFFSKSKVKDWKRRRKQLREMIHDNARFYQVSITGRKLEMYNKEEFINKLTFPTQSLSGIEVLGTQYSGYQISSLRFIQH